MEAMYSAVMDEINGILDRRAENKEPLIARWVTQELCAKYTSGLAAGDDADFWRWTGYRTSRDLVAVAIRDRAGVKPDKAPRRQFDLGFPGREHLQDYYLVKRDGEEIGVPVFDLTDDELRAKAGELRKMGATCLAHADEIDQYRHNRAPGAVEAA